VDIHRSGRNRDAEIAIVEGVYDTKVQQGIEREKAQLWEG